MARQKTRKEEAEKTHTKPTETANQENRRRMYGPFSGISDNLLLQNKVKPKKSDILFKAGVDLTNIKILNGPFLGMRYHNESHGSDLASKIIGSYEEPIHTWIEECISNGYRQLINIGCAEGYYAVGFSMRIPEVNVYAFDSNESAMTMAKKNAQKNGVRITFGSECNAHILNELITDRTLIFCDIEGAEKDILNPSLCEKLKYADIIVETHDCYRKAVTETLIERFFQTHRIEIRTDYMFRIGEYQLPLNNTITDDEFYFMQNEGRESIKNMWMFMRKHHTVRSADPTDKRMNTFRP